MKKYICDVCKTNTANYHFKVKELKSVVRSDMHVMRWVRIDICDRCYNKLLRAKEVQHD